MWFIRLMRPSCYQVSGIFDGFPTFETINNKFLWRQTSLQKFVEFIFLASYRNLQTTCIEAFPSFNIVMKCVNLEKILIIAKALYTLIEKKIRNKDLTVSLGCMLILFSILLGCATDYTKEVYRGYFGIEPPESELATLDLGTAFEVIIDDMYYVSRTKYSTVKLLAGAHKIQWESTFGVSVLVEPAGYASFGIISKVHLEAGHTYRLSADRTTGHGYRVFMWIDDTTTGKIVHGEKKP